jgi:hypothetical protein
MQKKEMSKLFSLGKKLSFLAFVLLVADAFFGRFTVAQSVRAGSKPLAVTWEPESL